MEETQERFWKTAAQLTSIILHPLLLPSILFILIYFYIPSLLSPWNDYGKLMVIGMISFTTYVIPLMFSLFYYYSSTKSFSINNLLASTKEERVRPFIIVGLIYFFLAYLLNKELRANYILVSIIGLMSCTIFLSAFISNFWKISIHSVGAGGLTAFLLILNERYSEDEVFFYFIVASIIISGFILSARLYLNEHNFPQVAGGWLLGMLISLGGMMYLIL